jgi:replicative DNA helicase
VGPVSAETRPLSPDEDGTSPDGGAGARADRETEMTARGELEPPIPFGTAGPLPPFPLDTLPDWGSAMIEGVSEETQTPADLAGVVFLGALSAAAGGRAVIEVRPGWTEPVNLYTAVVMPPGSRKSAVFREMTTPITDAERQLCETARADIQEQEVARTVADEAAKRAIATAAKDPKNDHAKAQAIAAAGIAMAITPRAWPRLLADDVTPEAATSLLAQQGGRLAILSAEGDIFDVMSGRYSAGQIPNLGVFLKGHAGDTILVDRKGREPERIDRPALTIGLCIQPQVLLDIARRPVLRGRGLLARVLYSLPADVVGYREIEPDTVQAEVRDLYRQNLAALVVSLDGWTDPAVLLVTPEAAKALAEFQRVIEPRLRNGAGDLAAVRDWASKLAGAAVRIAGLLHLAEHLKDGWGKPIEADTMERAVQLGEYFTEHARAAFDQMGTEPLVDDARVLLAWIKRTEAKEFTKRDLHRGVASARFRKSSDLDEPLVLLQEHGYARLLPAPARTGSGRPPAPLYATHPEVFRP